MDLNQTEVSLKKLIEKENYTQYIELLHATFQKAETTKDLDNLLVLLFKIELEYKVYKQSNLIHQYKTFLLFIKKLICDLLSQGIIPHKEYLHLYNIFSNFEFSEDKNITVLLDYFKNDILDLSWDKEDKFIENNIILLLEILNGNRQQALVQYTKNILLTNIHLGQQGLHCQFIDIFSASTKHFSINIIIEAISFYLDTKVYFSLSLNEKKSLFAWAYELLINTSKFTKNLNVHVLYPLLKNIIEIHIQNKDIEELMYAEFFTMISQSTIHQKSEELEIFNKEITYPCGEIYKEFSIKNSFRQPEEYNNPKQKIAFLFERLVEHSPFKVVLSLLTQLQKDVTFTNRYEIEVFSLNYFLPLFNVKEIEDSLMKIGVKVIYPINTYLELDNYSSRIDRATKIRNTIIDNKIDIMIACFNSYDILNFLFTTRTAKKQIFWSHNLGHYNVSNIDLRISHFEQFQSPFDLKIFSIPIDFQKYNPKVDMKAVKQIRKQYKDDAIILGAICRLIKINSLEYLETIAEIMKQNPKAIYLACGSGDQVSITKKIAELGIEDKFYFTGHINPDIYGHVLDLYLSPFPMSGGESLYEYAYKGNAFVYMSSNQNLINNNIKYNFLDIYKHNDKRYIKKELYSNDDLQAIIKHNYLIKENTNTNFYALLGIVYNSSDYIKMTNKFINDKILKGKVIDEFLSTNHENENKFINILDQIKQ
jgi:hypothetical protein